MPNYRGHLKGGFGAFALIVLFAMPHYRPSAVTMLEWLLFAIAGSLFPDVDIKSKGQKYFYHIILILFLLLILNQQYQHLAIISIISLMPLLVKHRGIFHTIWFVMLVPLAVWYISTLQWPLLKDALWLDTVFFIAGALSHLFLDKGKGLFFS